jgi:hypothetical protein
MGRLLMARYEIQITDPETGEMHSEALPGDEPGGLTEAFLIEQIGWNQAKTVTIWIGEIQSDWKPVSRKKRHYKEPRS